MSQSGSGSASGDAEGEGPLQDAGSVAAIAVATSRLTNYPSSSDVLAFFASQNIKLPDGLDVETAAAAAQDAWEDDTDNHPFIAETATYWFDPVGVRSASVWRQGDRIMEVKQQIRTGILSLSQLRVGLTADDTEGTLLAEGVDYWLWPRNADREGRPFTAIEFRVRPYGEPNSIKAVGMFGFATALRQRYWSAVRAKAASLVIAQIQYSVHQGAQQMKQGPVEYRFDAKSLGTLPESWQTEYDNAVDKARSYSFA